MKKLIPLLFLTFSLSAITPPLRVECEMKTEKIPWYKDSAFYGGLVLGSVLTLATSIAGATYLHRRYAKQETEAWYAFKFMELWFSKDKKS